jgi:hypothetical protein
MVCLIVALAPKCKAHGRMARDCHGLPKVSPRLTMPYPSMPCPETALWPFQGWPACRAGNLRPSSTPLDIPRRTPMAKQIGRSLPFVLIPVIYKTWRPHRFPLPNPDKEKWVDFPTASPFNHGRISSGVHGLPKISLCPAILYYSTPCRRPPWNALLSFQRWVPAWRLAVLLPIWIRHAIRACLLTNHFQALNHVNSKLPRYRLSFPLFNVWRLQGVKLGEITDSVYILYAISTFPARI